MRDGTAWLLWGSACNYIAESECMEGAYRLRPPFLFLIAVSLCACRRSNEEYSGCDSIGLWDDRMTNVQGQFTTKSIKIFVSINSHNAYFLSTNASKLFSSAGIGLPPFAFNVLT